mgnify:CR=1 FL=1
MRDTHKIVYAPQILTSMTDICNTFGVGEKIVKAWVREGAPIAVEGKGKRVRYSAEAMQLQAWRCKMLSAPRG